MTGPGLITKDVRLAVNTLPADFKHYLGGLPPNIAHLRDAFAFRSEIPQEWCAHARSTSIYGEGSHSVHAPTCQSQLRHAKIDQAESASPSLVRDRHSYRSTCTSALPSNVRTIDQFPGARTMTTILLSDWFITTTVMFVAYLLIGYCSASVGRHWDHQRIVLDPRKIVAGSNRMASWSSFQMLYFTFIVLWLSFYWLLKHGRLVELQGDLAILLGVAGAGTVLGKATDNSRSMLSQVNFSWIRNKKWIRRDLIKGQYEKRTPKLFDLITTDGKFDISRFQAVGFTLIIGGALLVEGIRAVVDDSSAAFSFSVGQTYLALIGVSQGVYIGGKFSQKDNTKQLDQKLDQVREKEQAFRTTVSRHSEWKAKSGSLEERPEDLYNLARECAPAEFSEFLYIAEEAANLVSGLSGKPIYEPAMKPSLPPVYS